MSTDILKIKGLEIWCQIGVSEEERRHPQRLLATLEFGIDCSTAARSDDIADSIDYSRVAQVVKELAGARPRKLIETLAEEMAQVLLHTFAVRCVSVKLEKSALKDAQSVSIKITRTSHE